MPSNEFFTPSGTPESSAQGSSLDMRAELTAVSAGFDKLPAMAGNENAIIKVNAAGTALVADSTPALSNVSWTPVLTATTPGNLTIVYSSAIGAYSRVGALTKVSFYIATSTFTHTTASGTAYITGFPLALSGGLVTIGVLSYSGYTRAGYTHVNCQMGNSNILFNASGTGVALATVVITDFPTGGTVILHGDIWVTTEA